MTTPERPPGGQYPPARRLELTDVLHGHTVADPYRWLEDAEDPETIAWLDAQDSLAQSVLGQLRGRAGLERRLHGLMPGFEGPPLVIGQRRFLLRRQPDQDHAVLLVQEGPGRERVLVDPNALSPDHTTTLDAWTPSVEGDLLAYQLSEGGDEEAVLRVMDVATGEVIDGPVDRVRYSPVAWLPGGRQLLYARRLPPDAVPEGEEQFHRRVYLHTVGSDPGSDRLVFGDGCDKTAYFDLATSRDGRWATVSVSLGTAPRTDLYLTDLTGWPEGRLPPWRPVLEGLDAQAWPHLSGDGRLYLLTDLGAPRRRVVTLDPSGPDLGPGAWRELVAEDNEAVLETAAWAGDTLVVARTRHAVSEVAVHDRSTGALRTPVALPGLGAVDLTGRPDEGPEVWVGYTDHVTPYRVLRLDPDSGRLDPQPLPPGVSEPPAGVSVRQEVYRSADGTPVRLFIVAAAEAGPAGTAAPASPTAEAGPAGTAAPAGTPAVPRPTILTGYGGFDIAMTPVYAPNLLAWVEKGGVYAIACLRGGSEEGEEWHRAGMRENKHHVFEDFEGAANYLVSQGWTTPGRLGISGGSNGGLLVGAALTRSPERYASVVCSAPLLDMVRYERFGLGETWNDEYGSARDRVEFEWLLSYSPYHRVQPGTAYPAVLFTVFDSDSRVDPLHGRKMCAALQWATSSPPSERPIVLRREAKVGHAARSVERSIQLWVDSLAFQARQLGLPLDVP